MARTVKWFTTLLNTQALASAGQTNFNLLADLAVANAKGSTVTRLIIDLMVHCDTDGSRKTMDLGVVWLDGDAVAAGAFPEADAASERVDWLMRGRMKIHRFAAASLDMVPIAEKAWDIRSQRICRAERDELQMICDLDALTVGGVFITGIIRTLVRLP